MTFCSNEVVAHSLSHQIASHHFFLRSPLSFNGGKLNPRFTSRNFCSYQTGSKGVNRLAFANYFSCITLDSTCVVRTYNMTGSSRIGGSSAMASTEGLTTNRIKKRKGKPFLENQAREALMKSLDDLGLPSTSVSGLSHQHPYKRAKTKKRPMKHSGKSGDEDGGASSGAEYTGNLLETYIGQVGACFALGLQPAQILNLQAWNAFSDEERDSLLTHLPDSLTDDAKLNLAARLVSGDNIYFGSPRDTILNAVAAGVTHPRVRRWRLRVSLIERRHHLMSVREFHNGSIRRLCARKALVESHDDSPGIQSIPANVVPSCGNTGKSGAASQITPGRVQAVAEAAQRCPDEWDEERWQRVLDFRAQETQRYKVPERAFRYHNPWGDSIVGPLKRGPALDGGRPREHVLLRNERPSHVTILCIVRDAASRLPGGRGTRADICDLLRDSQYIREGATYQQLNTVVSGALDRLHYEESAPVKYDAEHKEWVYLHNGMMEDDFERPAWARENALRTMAAAERAAAASASGHKGGKYSKKKRRKTE